MNIGQIISFKHEGKRVTDPNPHVLILNPNWAGKLHGLNLNRLSENAIKKLTDKFKKPSGFKGMLLKIPGIKKLVDYADPLNGNEFYTNVVKADPELKKAYRTYLLNKVNGANVIGVLKTATNVLEDVAKQSLNNVSADIEGPSTSSKGSVITSALQPIISNGPAIASIASGKVKDIITAPSLKLPKDNFKSVLRKFNKNISTQGKYGKE